MLVQGPALRRRLRVLRPGRHGLLPLDLLQPERANRLGKPLLSANRSGRRLAAAGDAPLLGPRTAGAADGPGSAKHSQRRVSRSARTCLLDHGGLGALCAGGRAHRRSALLGPERVRGHQNPHRLPHLPAACGQRAAAHRHRRTGALAGTSHAHPVLRAARGRVRRRFRAAVGDSRRSRPPRQCGGCCGRAAGRALLAGLCLCALPWRRCCCWR